MTDKIELFKRFQKIASQLDIGKEVEKEHKNDITAEDIAKTHLKENPEYYQKLKGVKKETLLLPKNAMLKKRLQKLAEFKEEEHPRDNDGKFKNGTNVKINKEKEGVIIGRKDKGEIPQSPSDWYHIRLHKPEHMKGVVVSLTKEDLEKHLNAQSKLSKLKENLRLAKIEIDHHHRIEFEQRGKFQGAKLVPNKASKFWEYFLLTAKDVNGNGWGVSPDTIDTNIKDFIGQPFVITAKSWIPNSEYGSEYTHPYIPTNHIPTIFAHQNKFAVGIIREVIKKGDDYSAMVEPFPKYASLNPPPFCSPGIFQTNRSEPEGNIRSWRALHLAGLDAEPAYGARIAMFKGSCVGTKDECKVSFHGAKLVSGIECPILYNRFNKIR